MKNFFEFYQLMKLREEEAMAMAQDMPMAAASGAGEGPVNDPQMGGAPPEDKSNKESGVEKPVGNSAKRAGGPTEDKILEDLGNDIRRTLERRMYPALDKKHLSVDAAMNLFNTIGAEIANRYGVSPKEEAPKEDQEGDQGEAGPEAGDQGAGAMATNSEPLSPAPKQPQAQ